MMAPYDSPALLRLSHTLDFFPNVCITVEGQNILTSFKGVLEDRWDPKWHEAIVRKSVIAVGDGGVPETTLLMLEIKGYSYHVVRASILWLMSEHIEFDVGDSSSVFDSCFIPAPVPAFDVYRFADEYGIEKLAALSLETMQKNFKPATIIGQIFEDRVKDYPTVKEDMMHYAKDNWGEVQKQPEYTSFLGGMMNKSCTPHEISVLLGLLLPKGFVPPSSENVITPGSPTQTSSPPEFGSAREVSPDIPVNLGSWSDIIPAVGKPKKETKKARKEREKREKLERREMEREEMIKEEAEREREREEREISEREKEEQEILEREKDELERLEREAEERERVEREAEEKKHQETIQSGEVSMGKNKAMKGTAKGKKVPGKKGATNVLSTPPAQNEW